MEPSFFTLASDSAIKGMLDGPGGPFGAVLVRGDEVIVATGNTVGRDMDWSGHSELVAVREAGRILNTLDLSDCTMYATCQPCPMCVGVMMWAGIRTCYYASTKEDAAANGFSDQHLRDYLDGTDTSTFDLIHVGQRDDADEVWETFQRLQQKG